MSLADGQDGTGTKWQKQTTDKAADDEVLPDTVNDIDATRPKSSKQSAPPGLDHDNSVVKDTPPLDEPSSVQQRDAPRAALNPGDRLPSVPADAVAPTRRMDVSQQTPTQVNEDRDYTAYCDPLASSPVEHPTQRNTVDEPRTLHEGDTGAVIFGNLSDNPRPSSQISEDGGFDTTRGEWRAEARTSQLHSNPAYTPFKPHDVPPETPALPKNPFAANTSIAVPLAGTQLFGQTQQLSSAVKASPTSSRPSPNLFLNSISPNVMETSPLKNRANVSSPTDIQTSSPQRLHEVPGTLLKDKTGAVADSPTDGRSPSEDLIPESPTLQAQRPSIGRQPLAHYEPMKQSQERKSNSDVQPMDLIFDNEDDGVFKKLERRKRAEKRRAEAREQMERVSFQRHSRRESGEQPNRKKRRLQSIEENAAGDEAADPSRIKGQEPAVVRDSQQAPPPSLEARSLESTKATPGEASTDMERGDRGEDTSAQHRTEVEPADEEMIPATSPFRSSPTGYLRSVPPASEPELPALVDGDAIHKKQADDTMRSSPFPPFGRAQNARARAKMNPFLSSSASVALPVDLGEQMEQAVSTVESPLSTASHPFAVAKNTAQRQTDAQDDPEKQAQKKVPVSTRLRSLGRNPLTPLQQRPSELATVPSSSLTTLSATPVPSSKTTPGTQESAASDQPGSVNMISPGSDRNLRRRALRIAAKSESPQPITRATKVAKLSVRLDSDSTDELHHSPPQSTFDKSALYSKSGRSFRQSIGSTNRGRRLFEGMTFALSSQSDKPEQQRTRLESRVVQAGGSVLKDGFQELFEQSAITNTTNTMMVDWDDPLKLVRTSSSCGFTALIADGHSRKPKYMQALALGLPCLGNQWIAACLNKGEIVDWEPYLLCAGSSAVLGNAIRSRILPPYSAVDARLADVIEHRRRPLQDQSILVVMDAKKRRGETKQQYMFLVQGLGPSTMSRVSTAQQAREALRERERAGQPFDWLYIDKSAGTAESVLSPPRSSGSKKKKQVAAEAPVAGDIRVLTDELVIQSLILGRMVEQEELKI